MAIVRGDTKATSIAGKRSGKLSPIKATRARGMANKRATGTQDAQAGPANATPTDDQAQTKKTTRVLGAKRKTNMGDHYDWKPIVRGTLHKR